MKTNELMSESLIQVENASPVKTPIHSELAELVNMLSANGVHEKLDNVLDDLINLINYGETMYDSLFFVRQLQRFFKSVLNDVEL